MSFIKDLFAKRKVPVFKSSIKLETPPLVEKLENTIGTYDIYSERDTASDSLNTENLSQELEYQSRRYCKELVL